MNYDGKIFTLIVKQVTRKRTSLSPKPDFTFIYATIE